MKHVSKLFSGLILGLAFAFSAPAMAAEKTFLVSPKYGESLEAMVKNGGYDFVNPALLPDNFRIEKSGKPVAVTLVELDDSDGVPTAAAAEEALAKRGYRPATLAELLTLGATHPELQSDSTLIALGTKWKTPAGHMAVPALTGMKVKRAGGTVVAVRQLEVFGAGVLGWRTNIKFPAVRIKE